MITLFNIRPFGLNVGNDAIFVAMQRLIYKAFGSLVNIISIPATSKYESHSIAGLSAQTIHRINQIGDGVIIGGGNLFENGEIEVNSNALKALDVPMMIYSVSRGRVYNKNDKLVQRTDVIPDQKLLDLYGASKINLLRDKATFDYMKSIGCSNIEIGGCPTLHLNELNLHTLGYLDYKKNISESLIISIRTPELMNISSAKKTRVRIDILDFINEFKNDFSDVKLLCHDVRDIDFAKSIPNSSYIYTGDVFAYLNVIRQCKMVISYRLHSFLPALSFNTPAIKISYDERAISLIDTIGMKDWNINMAKEENVLEEVKYRYDNINNLTTLKKAASERINEIDKLVNENFKKFADYVNEGAK
jgi:polysaccharide pyruvyl transferase WcaK-like protein